MAGLADAATDRCSIASAPAAGPLTVCVWVKLANTVNATNTILRLDAGGGTALILALRSLVPGLYSAASTTGVVGSAVSTGTWTFLGATRDAANAGQLFQGTTPGSLTKTTATVNSSGSPSSVNVFGRSTSDATDWFSGTLAYVRVWTAVLSDAEVAAESQSATPVRTANLWASWALAAAALTDGSGNARPLVAGSTALSAATDPALSSGRSQAISAAADLPTLPTTPGRTRTRTAGTVDQPTAPSTPGRTRTRTLGTVTQTISPIAPAHVRSRTLAAVDQNSVPSAPGRTRARTPALAVTGVAALVPGWVRARTAGTVFSVLDALLPGRTRARTTPTVQQPTQATSVGTGRQLAVGTVVLATQPAPVGHSRARTASTVQQPTEPQTPTMPAGPWPPVSAPGRPVPAVAVAAGHPLPAIRVDSGQPRPTVIVASGRVVR